jgi:hypothetical protein
MWRFNWEEESVTFKGRGDSAESNESLGGKWGRGKSGCAAVGSIANASLLIGVEVVPELFSWCMDYSEIGLFNKE